MMEVKISDILELSKIIDSLEGKELTVSDAFEIYKFRNEMKQVYDFLTVLSQGLSSDEFDMVCNEKINFNIPKISMSFIVDKYHQKLSSGQKEILQRILLP